MFITNARTVLSLIMRCRYDNTIFVANQQNNVVSENVNKFLTRESERRVQKIYRKFETKIVVRGQKKEHNLWHCTYPA